MEGEVTNKNENQFTELKRTDTLNQKRLPGYQANLMRNKRQKQAGLDNYKNFFKKKKTNTIQAEYQATHTQDYFIHIYF